MLTQARPPRGYLSFTLHAHLPYVVNHGTWPHGMEWLHEAVAETYLPLLRVLSRLEADGLALHCNLNLSPVLMEQLVHPVFVEEFPKYLTRKLIAAREDEAFFAQSGEPGYAETARFWQRFFTEALSGWQYYGHNLLRAFQGFEERGLIEIITSAATHGFLPLLGTDSSVRAQVRMAIATHQRHLGRAPRGIWSPECGYRPAGVWTFPVPGADGAPMPAPAERVGLQEVFAESNLKFFTIDSHLVERTALHAWPYTQQPQPAETHAEAAGPETHSLYQPYAVAGQYAAGLSPVHAFPRDPHTGLQVWSGELGYPGDGNYLDFHKKRWPGGHRYWKVTGPRVEIGDKERYLPQEAAARVQMHAEHFVALVQKTLADATLPDDARPPVVSAPFDAELFGHWWFEGPLWLEAVVRTLAASGAPFGLISGSGYLQQFGAAPALALPEGSWGAGGGDEVWMNAETSWTWTHIYPAELFVREVCSEGRWRQDELLARVVRQMCRELLLLESSDWQFLITTGAARDYAELRFLTHNEQFVELKQIWQAASADGRLNEHSLGRLAAIEARDSLFPDLDPGFWAEG